MYCLLYQTNNNKALWLVAEGSLEQLQEHNFWQTEPTDQERDRGDISSKYFFVETNYKKNVFLYATKINTSIVTHKDGLVTLNMIKTKVESKETPRLFDNTILDDLHVINVKVLIEIVEVDEKEEDKDLVNKKEQKKKKVFKRKAKLIKS